MDNQNNYPNDGGNSDQDRPLTSFLQAQQTVRTEERSEDEEKDSPSWQKTLADTDTAAKMDESDDADDASGEDYIPQFGDILSDDSSISGSEDGGSSFDEPKAESYAQSEEESEGNRNEALSGFNTNKLNVALKALRQMEQQITTVIQLLEGGSTAEAQEELKSIGTDGSASAAGAAIAPREDLSILKPIDGRVVEGVFDGRGMVGSDGKNYLVPPNYASKSKLIEGDMLKLTITPKGSFIYKQIGPIERSRLIGELGYDQTIGEFYATSENRRWNVLKASVTYFKGESGDEVVLLVPKNAPSKWAAVENIIKKNPLG